MVALEASRPVKPFLLAALVAGLLLGSSPSFIGTTFVKFDSKPTLGSISTTLCNRQMQPQARCLAYLSRDFLFARLLRTLQHRCSGCSPSLRTAAIRQIRLLQDRPSAKVRGCWAWL